MYAKKFFGYKTFSLVYIHNNRNLSKSQGEMRCLIWRKYPVFYTEKALFFGHFVVMVLGVFGVVFMTFSCTKKPSKTNIVFCMPYQGHFDCELLCKPVADVGKQPDKKFGT